MVDVAPKRMSPLDRISGLPESIISDILCTLPTKEAVATRILSQSWRFRWTRITSFSFGPKNQVHEEPGSAATSDFSDFVNMVLLNHCGESINKFALCWESAHFRAAQFNMWLNIAIARNVRFLHLSTKLRWTSMGESYLPFSLYTSGTLEDLYLSGPFRVKPPNVVCLPKLTEMRLSNVIYESGESLPVLISGCPLLKSLTIDRTMKSDNMVVCSISAPALKRLQVFFYGVPLRVEDVHMELKIDAPKLEYLDLFDHFSSEVSIQPRLSSVNNLIFEVYTYHNRAVELLQDYGIAKFLSIEENRTSASHRDILYVTNVTGEGFAKYSYTQRLPWRSMMDVIDCCIKLEELEIWCFESNNDLVGHGPRSLFSSLRCLTLRNFRGCKEEMEMLKFFLDHGLLMETVTLSSSVKKAKKKEILKEVKTFSRASPTCKISWYDFPGTGSCFEPTVYE